MQVSDQNIDNSREVEVSGRKMENLDDREGFRG